MSWLDSEIPPAVVAGNVGAAHMRALLRLAAWYPDQGFTSSAWRIDDFLTRLLDQEACYGALTWRQIREAFLATGGIKHHMFYRPLKRWDVQIYDIGFVRNGGFTRLCNVADRVDFALEYQSPLSFATFPNAPPDVLILADGMTRYSNILCDKRLVEDLG
jgi:hypothetical protein